MNFKSFKKSLDQFHIYDAAEFLVELYIKDPKHFKKSILLSDSLPDPINEQIVENKMKNLYKVFIIAGHKLFDKNEDIAMFLDDSYQILSAIKVINQNSTSNLKRLEHNSFLKYTLSQQLQMICIYIEDQNRLFNEQNNTQSIYLTGMENNVARYEADDAKGIKVSPKDNLEGLLEITDTLFRYLYFKSKNSKTEENFYHKNISPYGIGSLQEIIYLASQRNTLLDTWEKFKFREWDFRQFEQNKSEVNLFEPPSKEDYLKERIATDRYSYRDYSNMQRKNMERNKENQESIKYLDLIARNLEDPEMVFSIDEKSFHRSKPIIKNVIKAQLESLHDNYLNIEYKGLKITDLLKGFEYLFTISTIYQISALNNFKESEISDYQKLTPIIDKATLINQFSQLYDLDPEIAELVINTFIFLDTYKLDVFSQPLISVSKKKLIFCPSLIMQMNIIRIIEMLATEWNKTVSNKGVNFENEIRFVLSFNQFIEVNTNKIKFKAYDGRDVEFDFIAKFEDQILLIEFKHIKRPFSAKMRRNALKTIDNGIEQVNRRENVIINDWNLIKERCSFKLPDSPPKKGNIIKLVCTNILDFTSIIRNETEIIDSSSLMKFFMSPEIKGFSIGDEVNKLSYKSLWENGAPSVEEFRRFLNNPVAIQPFKGCYDGLFKPIQKLKNEDNNIFFFDYNLARDPFQGIINNFQHHKNGHGRIKVGRNEKCPCGSGKKYKKCCGK